MSMSTMSMSTMSLSLSSKGDRTFNIFNSLLLKNIAYIGSWKHFVFVFVCLCIRIGLLVSLSLGHCHLQMISFQKIHGLYGLEHHMVEINVIFHIFVANGGA